MVASGSSAGPADGGRKDKQRKPLPLMEEHVVRLPQLYGMAVDHRRVRISATLRGSPHATRRTSSVRKTARYRPAPAAAYAAMRRLLGIASRP